MQRREFLGAVSVAAAGAMVQSSSSIAAAAESAARQFIELRIYHLASAEKQKAYDEFLAGAAVAAFNRAGIDMVGVFRLNAADNKGIEEDSTDLYVLLPHKSIESVTQLEQKLANDSAFQKAGQSILTSSQKAPAWKGYDATLMYAFERFPAVKKPASAASRLVQLRIYESHTNERALKKIQMFNSGGEIAIFERAGIGIVFFGQSLAGTRLPNLTYMLAFDDQKAQEAAWAKFLADPEWTRLKNDPEYKETVSNITNLILRPTAASQI